MPQRSLNSARAPYRSLRSQITRNGQPLQSVGDLVESVEDLRVRVQHSFDFRAWHAFEEPLYVPTRVGPICTCVRIVGGPTDVRQIQSMAHLDAGSVVHECRPQVAMEDLARHP